MIAATRIIVVTWLKAIGGKIMPSMLAPAKSYAKIVKSGRKFRSAKTRATFKISDIRPNVSRLIGKRTSENRGLII